MEKTLMMPHMHVAFRDFALLVAVVMLLLGAGCGPSTPPNGTSAPSTPVADSEPRPPTTESGSASNGGSSPPETAQPSVVTTEPETPFVLEDGFRPLTFADFAPFPAEATCWTATPRGFACTGKPRGYLATHDSFSNFVLRFEYRFPRPPTLASDAQFKGNTGVLVYITGEPKIWPVSLEVQGKFVQMGAIKENGGAAAPVVNDNEAARQQSRRPVGEWNALEVVSLDGSLTVRINGVEVCRSEPNFLSEGLLGWQSEDHPFEVRDIRIQATE
jgi:hypothetical protein